MEEERAGGASESSLAFVKLSPGLQDSCQRLIILFDSERQGPARCLDGLREPARLGVGRSQRIQDGGISPAGQPVASYSCRLRVLRDAPAVYLSSRKCSCGFRPSSCSRSHASSSSRSLSSVPVLDVWRI